jgi:uncharacterized protein
MRPKAEGAGRAVGGTPHQSRSAVATSVRGDRGQLDAGSARSVASARFAAVMRHGRALPGRRARTCRRGALAALLLLCLVGAGGCGVRVDTGGGRDAPAGGAERPRGTGSEMEQDVDTAVRSTNQFWARHWPELFTGTYKPPRVHGFYDGDNPEAGPFCGPQPPVPLNAFYCPAEDLLAWDIDLMRELHAAGDASVYLVVAHEWGHAIQQRLSTQLVTLDAELQADCLAGATLFGAARDGTIRFEQGDQEELARVLAALADRTPWTDVGDHGDMSQRIGSFARGGTDGVAACIPAR